MDSSHTQGGTDWRTILLAAASTGSAILSVALAIIVMVYQTAMMLRGGSQNHPLIDAVLLASAILFVGALLIPAAYYSIQRVMGEEVPNSQTQPMSLGAGFLITCVWLGITALAQFFYGNTFLRWFIPPLYILSIGLPVYFFARLAIGGINIGSRQKLWGALGSGMVLGTSVAAMVEFSLIILLFIGLGAYLAIHPELSNTFNTIKEQLTNSSNSQDILSLISPYLLNPLAIALALFMFSVFAPFVEEIAKSLTTWIVFNKLSSPAQGFVIGALSGTGFGLVESLLASAQPDSGWAVTLFVRGGSTLMHIAAASLTGWGIGWFRTTKRPARMIGAYILAMSIHGLWNACVVFIMMGSVRSASNTSDIFGILFIGAGITILAIISLGMPVILGFINHRLRLETQSSPQTEIIHTSNNEPEKV